MEVKKAEETVRVLADGVNPVTGGVLLAESPHNEPAVIRALFAVLEARITVKKPSMTTEQRRQDNLDNGRPANAGLPWTAPSHSSSRLSSSSTVVTGSRQA